MHDLKNFRSLKLALWGAIFLSAGSIIGIAMLGFFIPPGYWSMFGNNEPSVQHFGQMLHITAQPINIADFTSWFRSLLVVAWISYGALLLVLSRASIDRGVMTIGIVLAILIGAAAPPWLSADVYAYVAYGRMQAIYGLNPYAVTPSALLEHADEVIAFLHWDVVSVYGPLWTWLTAGLVAVMKQWSLVTQILAMKLLATAGHLALAFGAYRLAGLVEARYQGLAFAAIAFSPLVVLEGPGSGHNDVVMLALAIWGVILWQRGFSKRACLLLGLAGAIKFIAFIVLFWLVGQRFFRDSRPWLSTMVLAGIGIAPFFLLQVYFLGENSGLFAALTSHFSDASGKRVMPHSGMLAPLLLAFAACSLAIFSNRLMHWTGAWVLTTSLAIIMIGPPWPWYLMWPTAFLFAGYSKRLSWAAIPIVLASFVLMLGYTVVP